MPTNLNYEFYVVPQEFYVTTYLVYFIEKVTGFQIVYDSELQEKHSEIKNPAFKQAIIFVNSPQQCELVNRVLLKF